MSKFKRALTDPKLLIVTLMGFSSGLPLLLVGGTLKAWMTQAGVDLTTIGFFSLVKLPYTWKFIWSPIMDRFQILPMGRRRGWLLVSQIGLTLSLLAFCRMDPVKHIISFAACACVVAFFSASQDIVVDAYRREILPNEELGLGSSLAVLGYRLGIMVAGAGAFIFADHMPWTFVYVAMAAFMGVGLLTTIFCPEPQVDAPPPRTLKESVIGPLQEFFSRHGAWTILAFVLLYKVGESMASDMYNPFFIQIGYSNAEIATVAKVFGLGATISGGLIGGILILRLKTYRSLWLFGVLQAAAILSFSGLAVAGHSVTLLASSVFAENFTSGMATSAYVAFMAMQTNRRFTATQYALLTSLMGIPQALFGASTGWLAQSLGWHGFFIACALFTIPGLLILFRLKLSINEVEASG